MLSVVCNIVYISLINNVSFIDSVRPNKIVYLFPSVLQFPVNCSNLPAKLLIFACLI